MKEEATIYIVATPIGNLEDLSERARRILEEVDLIAAEDTRHTTKLLNKIGVHGKELISYYDQIEERRASELVNRVKEQALKLAVVSDAGTPCIADPGYRIVAKARQEKLKVVPIPGPSALTTIASVGGLPTDRLLFIGFLPSKKQALQQEIQSWKSIQASVVCYESARRLEKTLQVLAQVLPNASIVIARELTKVFEEIELFSVSEALAWVAAHPSLKGELSLMIHPGKAIHRDEKEVEEEIREKAQKAFATGASHRDLMVEFADCGIEKKKLYKLLLNLTKA